ncbi:hypothetical protein GCM10025868_30300 [Angustibacter aerolatus]|uniref:Uncharacterized protein n=1 Tax=Angustibacter aerolatus TaxID=1162965 RepID=A0ABQ6JHR6_9ACTN|nr:hypothetical protein GCM10025868_30300 [Angustibacter aerolatus]
MHGQRRLRALGAGQQPLLLGPLVVVAGRRREDHAVQRLPGHLGGAVPVPDVLRRRHVAGDVAAHADVLRALPRQHEPDAARRRVAQTEVDADRHQRPLGTEAADGGGQPVAQRAGVGHHERQPGRGRGVERLLRGAGQRGQVGGGTTGRVAEPGEPGGLLGEACRALTEARPATTR